MNKEIFSFPQWLVYIAYSMFNSCLHIIWYLFEVTVCWWPQPQSLGCISLQCKDILKGDFHEEYLSPECFEWRGDSSSDFLKWKGPKLSWLRISSGMPTIRSQFASSDSLGEKNSTKHLWSSFTVQESEIYFVMLKENTL